MQMQTQIEGKSGSRVDAFKTAAFPTRFQWSKDQMTQLRQPPQRHFAGGTEWKGVKPLIPGADSVEHSFGNLVTASPLNSVELITQSINAARSVGQEGATIQTNGGPLRVPSFQETLQTIISQTQGYISAEDAGMTTMFVGLLGAGFQSPEFALPLSAMLARGGLPGTAQAVGDLNNIARLVGEYLPSRGEEGITAMLLFSLSLTLPHSEQIIQLASQAKSSKRGQEETKAALRKQFTSPEQKDPEIRQNVEALVDLVYEVSSESAAILEDTVSFKRNAWDMVNHTRGLLESNDQERVAEGKRIVRYFIDVSNYTYAQPRSFQNNDTRARRTGDDTIAGAEDIVAMKCSGQLLATDLIAAGSEVIFQLFEDEIAGRPPVLSRMLETNNQIDMNTLAFQLPEELSRMNTDAETSLNNQSQELVIDPLRHARSAVARGLSDRTEKANPMFPNSALNPLTHIAPVKVLVAL